MKGLAERVEAAIFQDNDIIWDRESVADAPGRSLAEMEALGLAKRDLKWLERKGLAVRAYTDNGCMHFEERPYGLFSQRRFKSGSRVRWILLLPKQEVANATG